MDLNFPTQPVVYVHQCWLPRGAMDLNDRIAKSEDYRQCWLPRGAMDLNHKRLKSTVTGRVGSLVEPWI